MELLFSLTMRKLNLLSFLLSYCTAFTTPINDAPKHGAFIASHALRSTLFDEIDASSIRDLPIYGILDSVKASLSEKPNLLLEASPGAGKTTVIPLLASSLGFHDKSNNGQSKVIVVEPRRVATRSAAQRMSKLIRQSVGGSVGYAIRGESKQSPRTQILCMTDGVLLNILRDDPELTGYDVIILDEFHERGVGSDTALALLREVQLNYRPDLKLIVMSATLLGKVDDGDKFGGKEENGMETSGTKLLRVLGGKEFCNALQSDGRQYPITIQYAQRSSPLHGALLNDQKLLIKTMANSIEEALSKAPNKGDVLAFLPGAKEIRRTIEQLQCRQLKEIDIYPLFGALAKQDQYDAIYKDHSKKRRIIVSTPIAEASVTIEGITCVVDSGLRREPRYDVNTGLPRLVTVVCSKDSVVQRAGRAGRTQEGYCIRLFSEAELKRFPEHATPEILSTDLVPTTLLLTDWGCASPEEIMNELPFIDPPPKSHLDNAYHMLISLGALEEYKTGNKRRKQYRITNHGKNLSRMSTHPRFAKAIIESSKSSAAHLVAAVTVAALSDEELVSRQRKESDLSLCVKSVLDEGVISVNGQKLLDYAARINEGAESAVYSALSGRIPVATVADSVGEAIVPGFIDLIAKRRGDASYGGSIYMLSVGKSARLEEKQDEGEYIIVVDTITGDDRKVRIRSYCKVGVSTLNCWATEMDEVYTVASKGYEVRARRVTKVGSLELTSTPLPSPGAHEVSNALIDAIKSIGGVTFMIPMQSKTDIAEILQLRNRVRLATKLSSDEIMWPACFACLDSIDGGHGNPNDEDVLLDLIEPWLASASSVKSINLLSILQSTLTAENKYYIDQYFPLTIKAPDGTSIPITYGSNGYPNAVGKLQQFFGCKDVLQVGPPSNVTNVALSLLSPAGKVLAQTIDLPFFWTETYPSVRAEMRGKYPKHPWPEDPMAATATRLTKKQQEKSQGLVAEISIDKRKERSKKWKKKR
ncbi:hypothetical protein ACHAXS_009610 [Conticribra weissflogii]